MPSWQVWSGVARVMVLPSKVMLPAVAGLRPEMTSNSVVLPAPFGPPIPSASPGKTSKVISRTAARAPKYLSTPWQESSGSEAVRSMTGLSR